MLITLAVLLVASLFGGIQWHPAAANAKATVPTITPQDPTSLTLALIGAGTLAAYVALSRTIRSRRHQIRTRRLPAETNAKVQQPSSNVQRKSRGAA